MANENDLIRRGDLKDLLLRRSFYPAIVAAALKELPAVDAVEVVHGRWNFDEEWWVYNCSICRGTTGTNRWFPYCPNCGAKMDGERKDNERKAD